MIGQTIKAKNIQGELIQGVVMDRVSMPVPMQVPAATGIGKETAILPCDCYVVVGADGLANHCSVSQRFQVIGKQRYGDPMAGPLSADGEDESDLDIILRASE